MLIAGERMSWNDADSHSGFEPDMIPAAMLAQRIIGIMAHWREYMRESCGRSVRYREILTEVVNRGKLLRPSHIYTGDVKAAEISSKL